MYYDFPCVLSLRGRNTTLGTGQARAPYWRCHLLGMPTSDLDPIQFVRPGQQGLEWVARSIARLKEGDPLRPITVVVPNYFAGRYVRRYLGKQ